MTTVISTATRGATSSTSSVASKATTAATTPKHTSKSPGASAKVDAAAVVDLSVAARAQLAKLVTASTAGIGATAGSDALKSFDEVVQDRTTALADKLGARLSNLAIPQDEPINLKLDSFGNVTTDSPYKKKIEKLFKDDPDLAKEFKDVSSLNAMKAAQKALEAFEREKKVAKDDDERDAAYGRYTARLVTSQDLSGTMTLDDGKLRSASVEFVTRSLGETAPAKASSIAEQAAAQRISRTV